MIEYIVFFGLIAVGFICLIVDSRREKGGADVPPYLLELNKCESPIERMLFKALWQHGYNVVCQYSVSPYRLDMALVRFKIAIEADGHQWHTSPSQKAHDRKRDAYLRSKGWKVLRFTGSRIHRDMPSILKRIDKEVEKSNKKISTPKNAY